ncbi:Protein C2-DOMAIN ABA-RELATED 11 [Zea mays]|nr:Protein C2-DOMAIN ABA-RELATED 11 [Zea mays]
MGQAFLDLQPVAAATKLRRALRLTAGETNLRKVNPDADNCLLSDSFVTYANGEVAIDARLRLREVESGELFVTIKWIEPDSANTGKQADH